MQTCDEFSDIQIGGPCRSPQTSTAQKGHSGTHIKLKVIIYQAMHISLEKT